MDVDKRKKNEKEFGNWTGTVVGGRKYWFEVVGRNGGKARYVKEVDSEEITITFWQEIFDQQGALIEVHEKYPIDKGHIKI
jgi:hypothetical protein